MRPVAAALETLRMVAPEWATLPAFIPDGDADRAAARVDARLAAGGAILPDPAHIFRALELTPLGRVRAVILGQDPYPTPGDAHGLAFSYAGTGTLPRSLVNVFTELRADLALAAAPHSGDLTPWARQGVLLLNTALTVEQGRAGAHRGFGWERVTDAVIAAVSRERPAVAFLLWGSEAHAKRSLIDERRHLVLAGVHPSPLSAHRGFFGSRPFSRANAWLVTKGEAPIDWRL